MTRDDKNLIAWAIGVLIIGAVCFSMLFMGGCGGMVDPRPGPYPEPGPGTDSYEVCDYNHICEPEFEESYWNCLDCVDPWGGPVDGYCGDGVCYHETMISCWTDCRPRAMQSNKFPWEEGEMPRVPRDFPFPGPQPPPEMNYEKDTFFRTRPMPPSDRGLGMEGRTLKRPHNLTR